MSENTTETASGDVVEVPEYGTITLKPLSDSVVEALSELGKKSRVRVMRAIQVLTALTNEHNFNCAQVKRAADDNKDPKAALEQIRISNPGNDADLNKINARIDALHRQLEEQMNKAYGIAEKYVTAAVSTEEAEAKRRDTQKSSKVIRELRKNLETIAEVVNEDVEIEGGIMALIPEADSLRGVKLAGGSDTGEGAAKLRTDKLFLNGEVVDKKFETPQGDKYKSSFSILAMELNKRFSAHKDPANKVSAVELTNAMYDHIGVARGTKQAEIKHNVIDFPFSKTVNYTKNGVVESKEEKMTIRVVFNYEQWLKDNTSEIQSETDNANAIDAEAANAANA